jgi:hypothetical protein
MHLTAILAWWPLASLLVGVLVGNFIAVGGR